MKCSYYLQSHCQSCTLLNKSYPETLRIKEDALRNLFPLAIASIRTTIGLQKGVESSRHKAKFAVFNNDNGITFGFYQADGSPRDLELCPLHGEGINSLLVIIREILNKYNIRPYDLKSRTGELKYLIISKSDAQEKSEFLLRFVLRSKESLDRLKKAAEEMCLLPNNIKVITANIQPIHQAIMEGDEEIVLTEDLAIIHQFDEFKLTLGARSFFQVTPEIAKKLYGAVADSIALHRPASLIDLYCGVGAFSFYASRTCADIVGVEISNEAIECAKKSAYLNNRNIDFHAMDVEEYLRRYPRKFEAILVNPPRRGLNSAIIKMIETIAPTYIYYSSCNAETMARDFDELKNKYQVESLQVFDMFPYTSHFETLMCLVRK